MDERVPITFTVRLPCLHCQNGVHLEIDDWTDGSEIDERFVCPHCRHTNTVVLPGRIVRVTARPRDSGETVH